MYSPYGQKELLSSDAAYVEYAGMRFHEPSGLYLTYYRAYDPKLGRWLSRDPIGEAGGLNLYGYVGCRPGSYTDPWGLSEKDVDTILLSYLETMTRLILDKRRLPGDGRLNAWINNIVRDWFDPYMMDCADQAREVLLDLKKQKFDDKWDFNHIESPPHYKVQLVPSNSHDPMITLDPWIGSISIEYLPYFPSTELNPWDY